MVVLRQVERPAEVGVQLVGRPDRRHAGPQAHAGQLALEQVADPAGGGRLRGRRRPHRRAVLGADVVAVPVEAGRVVVLPEGAQQGLAARADDGGVVDHPHRLGVTGDPGAHLLVGGVGRRAAHVADGGDHDAGPAPQDALHAPEAAAGQVEHLGAPRPGAVQRRVQDDVLARVGQDRGLPPGQDGGARGARCRSGTHADTLPSRGAGTGPRSRRGRAAGAHRVVTSRISASICLPLGAA